MLTPKDAARFDQVEANVGQKAPTHFIRVNLENFLDLAIKSAEFILAS